MSELSSYLKQLKFDPNLKKGIVPVLLTNFRVTILLVLALIVAGLFALINLPRRINPEVEIPIVFISTFYSGAGPQDVERLVTVPLEEAIDSVSGIDTYSSNSVENVSTIVIQFESTVDIETATADVQSAVDTVRDLPADATDPNVVALDFEDIPVLTYSITSETDFVSLAQFAREMEETVENVDGIRNVIVSGAETSEIEILIKPETYQQYGINPLQLQQAIMSALQTYPAGAVTSNGSTISLSVEPSVRDLADLRQVPLALGEQTARLGEVATVSVKSPENQPSSYFATAQTEPRQTISFSVYKNTGADLEEAASKARTAAEELVKDYDGRFTMITTMDFQEDIRDQFVDLIRDFSNSIVLVFITLLLFLGFRQALLASFVIPLSFFATFAAMYYFDIQLSFLSLFSLLLGLGMIVDDTIVIISAMTDYYKSKKFTPEETGLLVWRDYLVPTLSSNLTNVWSFLPLLIATGIIGEFTQVISIVVTIALVGSTAIALIVTIPFMIVVLRPQIPSRVQVLVALLSLTALVGAVVAFLRFSPLMPIAVVVLIAFLAITYTIRQVLLRRVKGWFGDHPASPRVKKVWRQINTGFISTKPVINRYKAILRKVLESRSARRKTIIAVIILSLFSYMLVPLGFVKNVFFPETPADFFFISLELPEATQLDVTEAEALRLVNDLRQTPDVEHVVADVGREINMTSVSPSQTQSNRVSFTVTLVPEAQRERTSVEVADGVRDYFAEYDKGEVQVIEQEGGPPAGADLQITLLGDELEPLQEKAEQVRQYMLSQEGVDTAEVSIQPGTSKLIFQPNLQKISDQGVSLDQIGIITRMFASGIEVDQLRLSQPECEDECAMMLRLQSGLLTADQLSIITIPNQRGEQIPLSALGTLGLTQNPTSIAHQDGRRSITITGTTLPGFNPVELGQNLETFADTQLNLPSGYDWQTGGVNEENQESINSILQAMVIALILILATMVIELQSFRKAVIVMLVIPLAVTGVFILFAITGTPLSFPALIGLLALFGIVVKNSILIVDKINRNLEIGMPFTESVTDGATSRLEPIFFSSVTNIIGLVPITISDPLWRGLGGAIIAGLSMSGMIMLVFIPVLYYTWFAKQYQSPEERAKRHKAYPEASYNPNRD